MGRFEIVKVYNCFFVVIEIQASFDCNKALTDAEVTICKEVTLKELDILLNEIYQTALSLKQIDQELLKRRQRTWLYRRPLKKCNYQDDYSFNRELILAYKKRIFELLKIEPLKQKLWQKQLRLAKQAVGLRNYTLSALAGIEEPYIKDSGEFYPGEYMPLNNNNGIVIVPLSLGAYQGTWAMYQVETNQEELVTVTPLKLRRPDGYVFVNEDDPDHHWFGNLLYLCDKEELVLHGARGRGMDPPNIDVHWSYIDKKWEQVYYQSFFTFPEESGGVKEFKSLLGEWEHIRTFSREQDENLSFVRRVFNVDLNEERYVGVLSRHVYGGKSLINQDSKHFSTIHSHEPSKEWDDVGDFDMNVEGALGAKVTYVIKLLSANALKVMAYAADGREIWSDFSGIYLKRKSGKSK